MSSSSNPFFQLQSISKSLKNNPVLQDISIYVKKGELVSIVGPSGCGKSTLLNIIAGVERETYGTIFLNDTLLTKRLGMFGYMLQDPLLLPWRTVEENMFLGLEILHSAKGQSRKKAHQLLKQFNLERFGNYYPTELSGGMQQRIALLRTLLFNSSFLLLDEPFGSLDAITRREMQLWLLKVLKKYKTTTIFVTHDIREALVLSDRIYVFSKRPGKIRKELVIKSRKPKDTILYEKKLLSFLT